MTNLVRTELEAAIAADLPDNTEQQITASRLRSACTDLNDTIFRGDAIALSDKTGRIMLGQGGYLLIDGVQPNPLENLKTSLVSWWGHNETVGTRVDSHGSNDFTVVTAGSSTGLVGNASVYGSNTVAIRTADSPTDAKLTGDKTIAFWIKPDNLTDLRYFGMDNVTANREWNFNRTDFSGRGYTFAAWNSSSTLIRASSFIEPVVGEWALLIGQYDDTAKEIGISVDGGIMATIATGTSSMFTSGTAPLVFGIPPGGSGFVGAADESAIWNRLLTVAEITALYNSGSGIGYGDLP